MNGILNVNKEKGYTSHDVVAKLRGILHQKKIGHTGTLDPDATGVLPVCVGNATKLCGLLTDRSKEYEAVLLLGMVTDTQDISGQIEALAPDHCLAVEAMDLPEDSETARKMKRFFQERVMTKRCCGDVTEEEIRSLLLSHIGTGEQIPPMYSALKVNGKKLYELAREGIEVERKARPIEIYAIEILDISLPRVRFSVSCSKGTYIRTLCHDVGQEAGCGAVMESLKRTRVDRFQISDALSLSQIEMLQREGKMEEALLSVEAYFSFLPARAVSSRYQKAVENGNQLRDEMLTAVEENRNTADIKDSDAASPLRFRAYDESGRFYGIYREKETGVYTPEQMFL